FFICYTFLCKCSGISVSHFWGSLHSRRTRVVACSGCSGIFEFELLLLSVRSVVSFRFSVPYERDRRHLSRQPRRAVDQRQNRFALGLAKSQGLRAKSCISAIALFAVAVALG